jgi:hypothetical protein
LAGQKESPLISAAGATSHPSLGLVLDLLRQSSIENSLRAQLTVMDRNPEAVEKALMNKS